MNLEPQNRKDIPGSTLSKDVSAGERNGRVPSQNDVGSDKNRPSGNKTPEKSTKLPPVDSSAASQKLTTVTGGKQREIETKTNTVATKVPGGGSGEKVEPSDGDKIGKVDANPTADKVPSPVLTTVNVEKVTAVQFEQTTEEEYNFAEAENETPITIVGDQEIFTEEPAVD